MIPKYKTPFSVLNFWNNITPLTQEQKREEEKQARIRVRSQEAVDKAKKEYSIVTENDRQNAQIQTSLEGARKAYEREANYQKQKTQFDQEDHVPVVQDIAGDLVPLYNTYKFTKKAGTDFNRAISLAQQGYIRPALGYGSKAIGNALFGVTTLVPFTGIGLNAVTKGEKAVNGAINFGKNNYTAYRISNIIDESARHNIHLRHKNVPMEDNILYHTTEGRKIHPKGIFIRESTLHPDQKVITGLEQTPGQLKLDGNIYRSVRQKGSKDYIWWDTNEFPDKTQTLMAPSDYVNQHNYGKEVYIRKKEGSQNVIDNIEKLGFDLFGGNYRDSYYVTTPSNTTTDNTVKLVFDPFSNSYIPHVKGKIVNNRMTPTELLNTLESGTQMVQKVQSKTAFFYEPGKGAKVSTLPKGQRTPYTLEENRAFRKQINEFANKYGYEPIGEEVTDPEVLERYARSLIKRHNTFYRGVNAPDDITAIQYATNPPGGGAGELYITPHQSYAGLYGDKVVEIQKPFTLGKDRTKWFTEGDFNIGAAGGNREMSKFEGVSGIVDPWTSNSGLPTATIPTELTGRNQVFIPHRVIRTIPYGTNEFRTLGDVQLRSETGSKAITNVPFFPNTQFKLGGHLNYLQFFK